MDAPPGSPHRAKLTVTFPYHSSDNDMHETLEFIHQALRGLLGSGLGIAPASVTVHCQRACQEHELGDRLELTLIVVGLHSSVRAAILHELGVDISPQAAVNKLERVTLMPTSLVIDFIAPDHTQVCFYSWPQPAYGTTG